jgi:hypothetical protein
MTARAAWLALWLVSICVSANDWHQTLPDARLVGEGDATLLGLRLYRARLLAADTPLRADSPFVLELRYHRAFRRDTLVQASLDEMRRLGQPNGPRLRRWEQAMEQAFADVAPGDRLAGLYLPGAGCRFYLNGQLRQEIREPAFAEAFFAIWLSADSRDRTLRQQLLGTP